MLWVFCWTGMSMLSARLCITPPFPLCPPPQFPWRQQLRKRCSLHLVYRPAVVYREFRTNVRLQCALSSSLNRHSTHGTGAYLTGYLPGVTARHIHVSTPAAPGSSWRLLPAPGSSWRLLAAPSLYGPCACRQGEFSAQPKTAAAWLADL